MQVQYMKPETHSKKVLHPTRMLKKHTQPFYKNKTLSKQRI